MPEGDTIHRLAERLRPRLVGREVTSFQSRRFATSTTHGRIGKRVTSVEARGKNLLLRFDDGYVLHVHLRMHGRIVLERPGTRGGVPAFARGVPDLRLGVAGTIVTGSRLPVCRLLTEAQARRAPELAGLGPDLASPAGLTREAEDEALRRLRELGELSLGEALLVQRVAAGLGNIYKSEVLFLERLDPRAPVSAVDDERLRLLLRRASALLRANVREGPRATRRALSGPRLWVYRRGGRACLRCGEVVRRVLQGRAPGRSTYFCPKCQA